MAWTNDWLFVEKLKSFFSYDITSRFPFISLAGLHSMSIVLRLPAATLFYCHRTGFFFLPLCLRKTGRLC